MFFRQQFANRVRVRLELESLESRDVPASFRWNTHLVWGNSSWTNSDNWEEAVGNDWIDLEEGNYPGANGRTNDDVYFTSIDDRDANINVANLTLGKFYIHLGYKGQIQLGGTLNINNHFELDAPTKLTSAFDANDQAVGRLNLLPGTLNFVINGEMTDLTVRVLRNAESAGTLILTTGGAVVAPQQTRKLSSTSIEVDGELTWARGSVQTGQSGPQKPQSNVKINAQGVFTVQTSGTNSWGDPANPNTMFEFRNAGQTYFWTALAPNVASPSATLYANFTNTGSVAITNATLYVRGFVKQETAASKWHFSQTAIVVVGDGTGTFRLLDGTLSGTGGVLGNLHVGHDPAAPGFVPTTPVLSPGGKGDLGLLQVGRELRLFRGRFDLEVAGPTKLDRIHVWETFDATGPNAANGGVRIADVTLLPKHEAIPVTATMPFLSYTTRVGDFTEKKNSGAGELWNYGTSEGPNDNPKKYWVQPQNAIAQVNGKAGGFAWRDNGAIPGVFEPGVEQKLAGVTVRLFDEAGTTQLDSTVTDNDGNYEFDDLAAGIHVAEFVRPTGLRFAAQDVGTDDAYDSDADQATGRVRVALYDDQLNVSAGLYDNTPPTTSGASLNTPAGTQLSGTVQAFSSDADGDTLTASLGTNAAHGTLVLNADGSFTYTPNSGFTGTDAFTYTVSDGYGGYATGTVTVTVYQPITLTGRVWNDTVQNGIQDAGEGGVAGVLIQLLDVNGNVLAVAYTNANGDYEFANVAAGQYRLRVIPPPQAVFVPKDAGNDDDLDSDFDIYGYGDIITVPPGGSADFDAGLMLGGGIVIGPP